MEQDRIRVLSVDDHALLREGIAMIVNCQPDMVIVSQASGGREAIEQYCEHRPDITLMDLRMPDLSGTDALAAIRAEFPEARIIMLTTFESEEEVQRALKAGACGYLLKSIPPGELSADNPSGTCGSIASPPEGFWRLIHCKYEHGIRAAESGG